MVAVCQPVLNDYLIWSDYYFVCSPAPTVIYHLNRTTTRVQSATNRFCPRIVSNHSVKKNHKDLISFWVILLTDKQRDIYENTIAFWANQRFQWIVTATHRGPAKVRRQHSRFNSPVYAPHATDSIIAWTRMASLECTSRHGQRTCTDDGSSIAGRERSSTLKKPSLCGGLLCQIWPFGMSMFKNLLPRTMCRVLQIKSLRLCPVSHNFLQICPQLLGVILFADGVLPCVRLFF